MIAGTTEKDLLSILNGSLPVGSALSIERYTGLIGILYTALSAAHERMRTQFNLSAEHIPVESESDFEKYMCWGRIADLLGYAQIITYLNDVHKMEGVLEAVINRMDVDSFKLASHMLVEAHEHCIGIKNLEKPIQTSPAN